MVSSPSCAASVQTSRSSPASCDSLRQDQDGVEGFEPSDAIEIALADGFEDWATSATSFPHTHGLPFEGLLIRW